MKPLVSFVVPCYNLGHLLPFCIKSILAQDYENIEVLIMDNCSPDDTPAVAKTFIDPRVRHIRNESNIGHIRNYNKGLTLAQGKYVWLLSADDMLRVPHLVTRFVEAMEQNPRAGFVFCRAMEFCEGQERGIVPWADRGDQDGVFEGIAFLTELVENNFIVAPTVLMRKECLEKSGLFHVELPYAADWYMWCMLALYFDVVYLAEPMIRYRIHEGSLTTQYSGEYAHKCVGDEVSVLWRIAREAERSNIPSLPAACDAALADRAFHLLLAPLQAENPRMSVTEFEEILETRVQDAEGNKKIREAVYTRLAEHVTHVLYRKDAPITAAVELGVLWNMRDQSRVAGISSLCATCESVFLERAVGLLTAGLKNSTAGISVPEFEEALRSQIQNPASIPGIRELVYTTLADQQYTGGQYDEATRAYRLALTARPGQLKTWAKYLLLHTGGVGIRIRHLAN